MYSHSLMLSLLLVTSHLLAASLPDPNQSESWRVRDGLPNVCAKLRAGETVRVAYLGGSITEAHPGWRVKTLNWLQAKFPKAKVVEINASLSGTGSDYGACRLAGDVLVHKPDLLFVEFRVNGSAGFDIQSTEGIVRQTWLANPYTDICFVYTIHEWMLPDMAAGRQTEFGAAMERVCNHYGVPSIDFGPEVSRRVQEGSLIFKGDLSIKPASGAIVFSDDGCHPGDEGHAIYCSVFASAMEQAILPKPSGAFAHKLPKAISPSSWLSAELVPSAQILKTPTWHAIDIETDVVYRASFSRTHRMLHGGVWTATEGETLTLKWIGGTIGFSDIPQSLHNAEPMVLEVAIDNEKPFTMLRRRTTEPVIYSRFWYLPWRDWGEHTVRITLKKLPAGQRWFVGQFLVVGKLE